MNRERIDTMIRTDQEVTVKIGSETFRFTGFVVYDSLKKPPHRLEAFDRLGNAVFIMLKEESV